MPLASINLLFVTICMYMYMCQVVLLCFDVDFVEREACPQNSNDWEC